MSIVFAALMNRFLPLLLPIVFLSNVSFAAVNAGMVWEFRSSATGSMVNSCGYDSTAASAGTDYSQQDSAQYGFSDLATTTGTTNPCVVTSASHNFVSTDNGNTIHITSGGTFTAGWYEIISTSGNAATLDRACASGASTTAGVYKVGGACNFGSATLDSSFWVALAAGNTVWFKAGSYTAGSTLAVGTAGATQNPINIAGYNASRGDNPTGSSRPLISLPAFQWTFAANYIVKNLILTTTSANGVVVSGAAAQLLNNEFINTSTTAGRIALNLTSSQHYVANNEMISYRGTAVSMLSSSATGTMWGNYIHDSDIGIKLSPGTAPETFANNIIADNVTNAITNTTAQTTQMAVYGNTLYGAENKLGVGITFTTGTTDVTRVFNNIIYGFVTGVTHGDSGQKGSYDDYNDYFNNTTDNTNWTKGSNDIAVNPGFLNVHQVTGTGATSSGSVLTDGSASFNSKVTDSVDFLTVISSTGVTAGKYLITAHTGTTLTTDLSLGTGSNITYQVTYGHNFQVGPPVRAKAFPGIFPGSLTTGFTSIGAVQQMPGYPRRVRR